MAVRLVHKYNPEWPEQFETIKAFLGEGISRACIRIEHVGSTSIPGMTAKPIIDLILVIEPYNFETVKSALAARGYLHEGNLGIPEREAFKLRDNSLRLSLPAHHLYVCLKHSAELRRHIAFREYLKHHKEEAGYLSELKWLLADVFDNDRQTYIDAKWELCRRITEKALYQYGKNPAET